MTRSWGALGGSWGILGALFGALGDLGAILGALGAILGALVALFGALVFCVALGARLERPWCFWDMVFHVLASLGACSDLQFFCIYF